MSHLKIDVSGLRQEAGGGQGAPGGREKAKRATGGRRRLKVRPLRLLRFALLSLVLAVAPFALLVRGGVFAHQHWQLGPWEALAASGAATLLLVGICAWAAGRRMGAGRGVRRLLALAATATAATGVVWSLAYVSGSNAKTPEVRAEYASLHPLLRVAAGVLILADPAAVITDAGRTPDFYRRMGLPPNESSLHFRQADGFVHALDLRTRGRPEWRNRAVEVAFWAFGFHALRHRGTADHLHVSLRPGRQS